MALLATIALGFSVGLLTGSTGIGGGSLLAPALIILNVNPFISVGTDLFVSALTKAVGAYVHHRSGTLYREILPALCIGGCVGALAGAAGLTLFKDGVDPIVAQKVLRRAIGVVLFMCAIAMALPVARRFCRERRAPLPATGVAGSLIGLITTVTGIGVGSLSVPTLQFLTQGSSMPAIVGSSLVFGMVVTLIGAGAHATMHNIDYRLGAILLLGAVPGVALGGFVSIRAAALLRRIVIVLLVASGLRLVI